MMVQRAGQFARGADHPLVHKEAETNVTCGASSLVVQFKLIKKLCAMVFVFLLTTPSLAGDLAGSLKQAAALADAQEHKDRATHIYAAIDLNDYYQQKYGPVFQSCLMSTENADTSTFSFVVAIGADGRVLRLYIEHETNIFACAKPALQKGEFPHPPFAPYYMHVTMTFSK
jgi:hypothetical protein